jgi:Flp pilus assembly protein TadG
MFAALAAPILVAVTLAIDYAQAIKTRSNLQQIADQVAIASVSVLDRSEAEARNAGQAAFESGLLALGSTFAAEPLELAFSFTPEFKSTVTIAGTFTSTWGTSFKLLNKVARESVHAVAVKEIATLEIAVTADNSTSMSGSRIRALRDGLESFVTTLLPNANSGQVRIAIVPFSQTVRLDPNDVEASWFSDKQVPSVANRACPGHRNGIVDVSDDTPETSPFDPYAGIVRGCPHAMTMPLTSDRERVLDRIKSMQATGAGTANNIAAAWALRTLSAKWKDVWAPNAAPATDHLVKKIAVLMTDGTNDLGRPGWNREADTTFKTVCKNFADANIEVYIITLKMSGTDKALYEDCAAGEGHFLNANSEIAMQDIFVSIANELAKTRVRLTC